MNLENTIIQRSSGANMSSSAIYSDEATGSVNFSADSTTYFCNYVNNADARFDDIYSGTNIIFDVTMMSTHSANDDVPLCN